MHFALWMLCLEKCPKFVFLRETCLIQKNSYLLGLVPIK